MQYALCFLRPGSSSVICMSVSVCVCPQAYLQNCIMSDLHLKFLSLPMAVVRSSSGGVVIAYVVYFRFMDDVIDVIFAHGPGLVEACRLSTMLRSYLSLVNCRLHHAVTSDVSVRYTLIPLATKCTHFYY